MVWAAGVGQEPLVKNPSSRKAGSRRGFKVVAPRVGSAERADLLRIGDVLENCLIVAHPIAEGIRSKSGREADTWEVV